jgi:hypothetical protein
VNEFLVSGFIEGLRHSDRWLRGARCGGLARIQISVGVSAGTLTAMTCGFRGFPQILQQTSR